MILTNLTEAHKMLYYSWSDMLYGLTVVSCLLPPPFNAELTGEI